MKKIYFFLFLLFTTKAFSINDKFRVGVYATPGLSWISPQGKDIEKVGVGFSSTYGIGFDWWFHENYGLSTGVFGGFESGKLKNRDAFNRVDSLGTILSSVTEKYSFHNLDIPLYLKLRTNEFSRFRVFGVVGLRNAFTISSRATYSNPIYSGSQMIEVVKENISNSSNEVSKVIPGFKSLIYDVKLSVGLGADYFINSNQSVTFGIFYHNGFLNRIRDNDPKNEKLMIRNVELLIGFTF